MEIRYVEKNRKEDMAETEDSQNIGSLKTTFNERTLSMISLVCCDQGIDLN